MSDVVPTTQQRRSNVTGIFVPVLLLLAAMWVLEIVDVILPADLDYLGIRSRSADGLVGIPLAPFLHGGFDHLLANTLPFLVLGTLVAWRARGAFWSVAIIIIVLGGAAVWLLGPANAVTIGASGMVFGFLGYLLALGIFTRNWLDIGVSVVVVLVYGSVLWGVLPFAVRADISWQAHLFGLLAGVAAAAVIDRTRPAQLPAAGSR